MSRWKICSITDFTLIELLTVISIITLLTCLLLPALSRAKESGRAIVCQSNLKQSGLCVLTYTDEWNGYFPFIIGNVAHASYPGATPPQFTHFEKVPSICPTARGTGNIPEASGYSYNYRISAADSSTAVIISKVANPSRLIIAWDGGKVSQKSWRSVPLGPASSWSEIYSSEYYASSPKKIHSLMRHSKGANYLWADAHASYIKYVNIDYTLAEKPY